MTWKFWSFFSSKFLCFFLLVAGSFVMIIVHSMPCLCYSFENDLLLITHQYRLRSSGHQNFNLHLHSPVMPKIGFQYLKSLFSQNKLQFSSVIYFSIMIMHLFFCLLVSCIFWGFFHSEDILHMWTERVFFFHKSLLKHWKCSETYCRTNNLLKQFWILTPTRQNENTLESCFLEPPSKTKVGSWNHEFEIWG